MADEVSMSQLVAQVKVLAESVQLLIQRSEQLFKLQEERLNLLPQLVENQTLAVEELQVQSQAFKDSLGSLEGQTDDLAKATSALIEVVTPRVTELAESAQRQA